MNTTQAAAEQERQQIENAYSYIRLSSKKQIGDEHGGVDRQTARAKEIADAHEWQLSTETFADLGTSAFGGKNRLTGNLGRFIELSEQSKLPAHPVLILESWDRYSRDTLDETFESVRKLLKSGVAFHVGYGDRTFTKCALQSAEQRGEIERALEAAHNYSKSLSDRVSSAKQRKIKKVISGEMANLNDMAPTWVTYDKATKTYIPNAKSSVVIDVFKQYLAGESLFGIVRKLNAGKTPSFLKRQWHPSTIRRMLSLRSALGEFKGRAGVFPALIDQADFDKAKAMLSRNQNRKGRRLEIVNIFKGSIFCTCGHSATVTRKGSTIYYRCPMAYLDASKCTHRHVLRSELLEEDFFAIVLEQTPKALLGNADTKSKERLAVLETNKEAVARKMNTLLALDANLTTEEIKVRYEALKAERVQVEKDIADLRNTMSLIGHAPKAISEITRLLASGDDMALDEALRRMQDTLKDKDIRQRLQVLMPSIVKSIVLDFEKAAFTATFPSGKSVRHSIPV